MYRLKIHGQVQANRAACTFDEGAKHTRIEHIGIRFEKDWLEFKLIAICGLGVFSRTEVKELINAP